VKGLIFRGSSKNVSLYGNPNVTLAVHCYQDLIDAVWDQP